MSATAIKNGTSIAALGVGEFDGQLGMLRYGGERLRLTWHAGEALWASAPQVAITMRDLEPMLGSGFPFGAWQYLSNAIAAPNAFAYGWSPVWLRKANQAYAAGLELREHIRMTAYSFDPDVIYEVRSVWYQFDDGERIGPWIRPTESGDGKNLSDCHVESTPTQRAWASSGWTLSNIDVADRATLAPHFYIKHTSVADSTTRVDRATLRYQLVGVPD